MISWHRVGQKVVLAWGDGWTYATNAESGAICQMPNRLPVFDEVLTISRVRLWRDEQVYLHFEECDPTAGFNANRFRPVYPDIIDQLRNCDAPVPSEPETETESVRVKEEV